MIESHEIRKCPRPRESPFISRFDVRFGHWSAFPHPESSFPWHIYLCTIESCGNAGDNAGRRLDGRMIQSRRPCAGFSLGFCAHERRRSSLALGLLALGATCPHFTFISSHTEQTIFDYSQLSRDLHVRCIPRSDELWSSAETSQRTSCNVFLEHLRVRKTSQLSPHRPQRLSLVQRCSADCPVSRGAAHSGGEDSGDNRVTDRLRIRSAADERQALLDLDQVSKLRVIRSIEIARGNLDRMELLMNCAGKDIQIRELTLESMRFANQPAACPAFTAM